jgi:HPt (histidine-containing phosphotransfer) domain-containing protein
MNSTGNVFTLQRPPIDLAMLNGLAAAQGEGEPDLIVELIDLYLADTPSRITAMRDALATGDHVQLARSAHSVKGSSSTLGAVQVAKTCAELEVLARDQSLTRVAAVLARLDDELVVLRDAFMDERRERSERELME